MKVITADEEEIVLGTTETKPTISMRDFSRRVTDDFGVTSVVKRGFQRLMSVRLALPFDSASDVQDTLAELRASTAQWVADEDFAWLNFEGFYKDFSIDLAVPPTSYCTLTVEGLAETEIDVEDSGEDPAPSGASTLKLVQPTPVADGVLVSSNVPETDWPEWAAITIYPAGARVIKAATHRIYESVVDTNVGNDPAGSSGKWSEIGATNRWAMFDEALGSATEAAGDIVVVLNATAIDSVALLDVDATTVRVEAAGYDETRSAAPGQVLFLDLPATDGDITVTVAKSGGASVGTLLVGKLVTLGETEESPTAGITDFSLKEVDDFGEVTIVERAWAKRTEMRAMIRTDAVDLVANRIAAVRAVPALWIGADDVGALTVYGYFKDWSIEVDQNVSRVSLSIEGLSKAAQLGSGGATAVFEKNFYRRSASAPATPSGGSFNFTTLEVVPPDDWSAAIEDGDDPVWVSIAIASKVGGGGTAAFAGHTVPVIAYINGQDGVDGEDGAPGAPGAPGTDGAPGAPGADGVTPYTHYAYADSLAPEYFNFAVGSPGGRQFQGIRYNQPTPIESTDPGDYAWSDYIGPPNFGLAAFNSNSVVAGNKLIKVAGGGAWNASVHSTESFKGGASVSFVVDALGQFMVGLNTDPTTDAGFGSIDCAIYVFADSEVAVFEGGSAVSAGHPAADIGDVFTVTYNDKSVVYSRNGIPFYTNAGPTPGLTLFLDSSMLEQGLQFGRILSFTAAGTAGDNGEPGDPGVDGRGIDLSAPALTFAAYDDGTLKPGQISQTCKATFMSGGTDVSASTTWTVEDESGADAGIGSTGSVSYSSVTATGKVRIKGVYDGTPIEKDIAHTLLRDPAPPQTPLSQSTNIVSGSGVNASFPASPTGGVLTVTTDSDGDMRVKVAYEYNVQDAGSAPSSRSLTLAGQLFYREAGSGGAWTAWLGAEQGGTNATAIINGDGELTSTPGTITINDTKTSLSADTAYEIWFAHRKTAGSGTTWLPGYLLVTAEAV